MLSSLKDALKDIKRGIVSYPIWLMFGWFDIKLRYRRSLLGPFWLTLSVAFIIFILGLLYSQIFHQEVKEYLPFLGISLIMWYFISGVINEACSTFTSAAQQIKQISQPISLYALKTLWRMIIIFFHNAIVIVVIIFYFHYFHISILIFPLTFALVCVFFFFLTLLLGIICTRYRDVPQIVATLTQSLMFITPIFWKKEFLNKYTWITTLNPTYHLLELLRNPLLGKPFPFQSLYITLGMLGIIIIATLYLMARYKKRIAYWV